MKRIPAESLGELASGVLGGAVRDGAWWANRHPDGLRPLYQATEAAAIRMGSPAGAPQRFHSQTGRVRLGLRIERHARPNYHGTLIVDGQIISATAFGPDEHTPVWEGEIFRAEPGPWRTFDLWLPHMAEVGVAWLEVDDDTQAQPCLPLPRRWFAYGDSITQGMSASQPHQSVIARCTLALGCETLNLGVGGAVLDAALAEHLPEAPADLISIAYGTNDFNKGIPVAEYRQNAYQLLEALSTRFPGAPLVLITPLTWAQRQEPNERGDHLADYRAALTEMATAFSTVWLVDGAGLIPDDPTWFVDRVHPNDAGFARYTEGVLPVLQEAMKH